MDVPAALGAFSMAFGRWVAFIVKIWILYIICQTQIRTFKDDDPRGDSWLHWANGTDELNLNSVVEFSS